MSSKTTKAQRRAAKLNRRSKDYRRQIAAQARKDEQATKPAKKQTMTKAKNPSPKKVYRPKMNANTQEVYNGELYDTGNMEVFAGFMFDDDGGIEVIISMHDRRVPATDRDYEEYLRYHFNSNKPIAAIKYPYGVSLAMAEQASTQESAGYIIGGVLEVMEREKYPFYCVTSSHFGDLLKEVGFNVEEIIVDVDTAA